MGRISRFITPCVAAGTGAALLLGVLACNEHRVEITTATGAVETIDYQSLGGGVELDLLWLIDNSGSMCRSQEVLREGISDFVELLGEVNINFHLGVTTTHMLDRESIGPDDDYAYISQLEPVARPGYLQATPQPLPGFDRACHHSVYPADHPDVTADPDSAPFPGDPNTNNIDPVVANIETAVECTTNPDDYDHLVNFGPGMMWENEEVWEQELRCVLQIGGSCNYAEEDFFPDPADYREIPLVIRSADYMDPDTNRLDIDRLGADFSCMSLVGTRGHGLERGLDAVVTAVSHDMTGGPDGDPAEFPNAGFLRPNATTGVIFVTDENDCSHGGNVTGEDGAFIEDAICAGIQKCAIAENNGDLAPIDELADQFMANLSESRGVELDRTSVLPASFHARNTKMDSNDIPAECTEGWTTTASCRSEMGIGWSGHRYEEFLRQFETFFPEPSANNPESSLSGLICSRDEFSRGLEQLGDFFSVEIGFCIDNVYHCSGPDASCPTDPNTGEDGQCVRYPGFDEGDDNAMYYCDTGVEVRLGLPDGDDDLETLEATGYCVEDTAGANSVFPDTCVVDRSRFRWESCDEGAASISLQWNDPEWDLDIGGFDLMTRYTIMPMTAATSEDDADDSEEDDA